MKQINFQFHAKRSEMMSYLLDIANKNSLTIIGVDIFPQFEFQTIRFTQDALEIKPYEMIILSKKDEKIINFDYYSFMKNQKGNLIITFGRDDEFELQESSMGSVSDEEIDILWKHLINDWRKKCLKGAWVFNSNNNAKVYNKNLRYTKDAKEAFLEGVKITTLAENCFYELRDEN